MSFASGRRARTCTAVDWRHQPHFAIITPSSSRFRKAHKNTWSLNGMAIQLSELSELPVLPAVVLMVVVEVSDISDAFLRRGQSFADLVDSGSQIDRSVGRGSRGKAFRPCLGVVAT